MCVKFENELVQPRDAFVTQLMKKLSKIKVSSLDVEGDEQDNVCNDWEEIPLSPIVRLKLCKCFSYSNITISNRCQ